MNAFKGEFMRKVYAVLAGLAFAGAVFVPVLRAEPVTIKGELIDVACGSGKPPKSGAAHAACATSCAKRGDPVAVFAKDGMYVVAGDYIANKNEKLIEFMAKNVEVTGEVTKDKDGKMTIAITKIAVAK